MTNPILRYPLDLTGTNPNNLVSSETHTLATIQPRRTIVPAYGAFYAESLVVRMVNPEETGPPFITLNMGVNADYVPTMLDQAASLASAKTVCQLIVITNPLLMGEIYLDYQTVGGEYSTSSNALQQLIEALDLDERPVVYGEIINIPEGFPPVGHYHPISQFYGFGHLINALEALRQAILQGNAPDFAEIYQYLSAMMTSKIYPSALDAGVDNVTYLGYFTVPAAGEQYGQQYAPIEFTLNGLQDWVQNGFSSVVESATANTLTDSTQVFNWVGGSTVVKIVSGTGAGQTRQVVSGADDTLVVIPVWDVIPDDTSEYVLTTSDSKTAFDVIIDRKNQSVVLMAKNGSNTLNPVTDVQIRLVYRDEFPNRVYMYLHSASPRGELLAYSHTTKYLVLDPSEPVMSLADYTTMVEGVGYSESPSPTLVDRYTTDSELRTLLGSMALMFNNTADAIEDNNDVIFGYAFSEGI